MESYSSVIVSTLESYGTISIAFLGKRLSCSSTEMADDLEELKEAGIISVDDGNVKLRNRSKFGWLTSS